VRTIFLVSWAYVLLKLGGMKNIREKQWGVLEKTLSEFKKKGISSLEVIRTYLLEKYRITVSKSILKKRLEQLSH
jgi:hypothetical protein